MVTCWAWTDEERTPRWPWRWWCCGARGSSAPGSARRPRPRRRCWPGASSARRRCSAWSRPYAALGSRGVASGGRPLLGLLIQVAYLEGVVTGIELGVPAGTAALIAATQPLLVAAAGPDRTSVRQRWGLGAGSRRRRSRRRRRPRARHGSVVGVPAPGCRDGGAGGGHAARAAVAHRVGADRRVRRADGRRGGRGARARGDDGTATPTRRSGVLVGGGVDRGPVVVRRIRGVPADAAAGRGDADEHAALPHPAGHRTVGVGDVRSGSGAARPSRRDRRGGRCRARPRAPTPQLFCFTNSSGSLSA